MSLGKPVPSSAPRMRASAGLLGSRLNSRAQRSIKVALSPVLSAFRPGNVAMFHVGRVGSGVLGNMLGQSRHIYWAREIFEPANPRYQAAFKSVARPPDPIEYLRKRMRQAGSCVFGFETKFLDEQHLRIINLGLEEYIETLTKMGFSHYVILRRKNILRLLLSSYILQQTRISHLRVNERSQITRITLDVNKTQIGDAFPTLVDAIRLIDNRYNRLSSLLPAEKLCELTYEEHISRDPIVGYKRVMRFVGLTPEAPEVRFRKTNPYPIIDIVENFDDVERALYGLLIIG